MLGNALDIALQFHDRDVEALEVSLRIAQEPMGLFGLEGSALGVVGDAVERVHCLVVAPLVCGLSVSP